MKKLILTAMFAAAITLPASAATMFAVNTQFVPSGDNGIGTFPLTGTETSVTFSSGGVFVLQQCSIAALCGTAGSDTVSADSGTFDSTTTFTWNGGNMSYQVNTWSLINNGSGQYSILTTGLYHSTDTNLADTPGVLNFSFGTPLTPGGYYPFQATGASSPAPEPATMSLVGLGLAAAGLYRRRRQKA